MTATTDLAGVGRPIAYLTNVYPAVSHSFVKREILALEQLGFTVQRWSIRPCANDLPDATDRAEARLTRVVLARKGAVVYAALRTLVANPRKALKAVGASLADRPAGLRPLIGRLGHFAEACFLAGALRRDKVTHLHAHFGTNPAAVARLSYLLGGPPYSFTVHGPDEFDQPIAYALGAKIDDARFAVAISRFGRSQLMRWCRVENWRKLAVVRCGLDEGFLTDPGPASLPSSDPVFACVARLAPQKGLPLLVEAARLLRQDGCRFRIRVVGDGPLRSDLERAIAQHGLGECFEFMGWASAATVREVVLAARAFVLPSFAEGLPVAIMEALALRRPVITTRIAGIPELIDATCGWIVDAGSAGALADAMRSALAATPDELARMGETGRARVLQDHDARRNAAQLAQLIMPNTALKS